MEFRSITRRALLVLAVLGFNVVSLRAQVTINEFQARNSGTLADEDGAYSDWIELVNNTDSPVNLAGWHLTDDTNAPAKWTFPSTNIAARGYLVVFASGKDRAIAGAPLHANFSLSGDGEYLALTRPDLTKATEFSPAYPAQYDELSYGNGFDNTVTTVVVSGAPARWRVAPGPTLDTNWTTLAFSDLTWSNAATGLGFSSAGGGPAPWSYWPVREGAGTVASNLMPGRVNGTLNGGAAWATDPQRGTVLNFNGSSAYVAAGTIPRLGQATSNFTWSFWFRQSSVVNGNAVILGNRSGGIASPLQFVKFTPSNFEYYHGGNIGFMPYGIPLGTWQHLCVVKTASNLRYFAHGIQVGTATAGGDVEANPLFWGGDPGAAGEAAHGLLDDIALWTAALTTNQVSALAGGASPLALGGFGSLVSTDIRSAVQNVNASVLVRVPFTVNSGGNVGRLLLRMRYDDGFVAYLNGVEVARRNAPAQPAFNSTATAARSDAETVIAEAIDLTSRLDALLDGANVLAIHALNVSAADADLLVLPELELTQVVGLGGRYFAQPTPGSANDNGYLGVVGDVRFSHPRGFYETNFNVTLTCATAGAIIRYTTNGIAPTESTGLVYSGPIPVHRNTILRAGAFQPGYRPGDPGSRSYLFLGDVLAQNGAGLPSNWGNDWQMDARVVNAQAYSNRIRDDMKSLPVMSISLDPQQFWGPQGIYTLATSQGVNYERACSAEMFFPDGSAPDWHEECGLRIAGGASRSGLTPKHGMRLLFKTQYGAGKLNYPFYTNTVVEKFNSLALRPNFNMSWVRTDNSGPLNNGNSDGAERTHAIYVRDQWTKDSYLAMGAVGAHERFVHLYINGIYWGLYNPCERTDASFAEIYYGVPKEEWDAVFSDGSSVPRAVDGDKNAWNQMLSVANAGLATSVAYSNIQGFVDVTNVADYMMLNCYASTVDWPWQNWNSLRRRDVSGRFRFIVWDAEYTIETPPWVPADRTSVGTGGNEMDSPARIYNQLRANPEWRLLFADRVRKHFFNNGALDRVAATNRFITLCDTIDRGIVCESARWGDVVRTSQPYTRDVEWVAEKHRLLTQFFQNRASLVVSQFVVAGLYPNVSAPDFSRHGGVFSNQMLLGITASNGVIYYTTDGTDPRLVGGAVAPGALTYGSAVGLTTSTMVRARALSGGTWSALTEATFFEATPPPLRVTEIMFHPAAVPNSTNMTDDFEYLEVRNIGASPINLAGYRFTAGISFTFGMETLAPGESLLVTANRNAFAGRHGHGPRIAGDFIGQLSNDGEGIRLESPLGQVVQDFTYRDWYKLSDGLGLALVVADDQQPAAVYSQREGWRVGRSPGATEPPSTIPPVLVNEALTHTPAPATDAIELFNPTGTNAAIGGWWLTDDAGEPAKFRIPDGTLLPPGGYLVVTGVELASGQVPFALGAHGDQVWLYSANPGTGQLTGHGHGFDFGAAAFGVSFGRHVSSVGKEFFVAQSSNTLGAPNAGPRLGPVVLSEVHYHPVASGTNDPSLEEFVELQNISGTDVPLHDPAFPTNTWSLRGGLTFEFPIGLTLAAGARILVVGFSPTNLALTARFRETYHVDPSVAIIGPWSGRLNNSEDAVRLYRPDAPDLGEIPPILVEEVHYRDEAPWPLAADGPGPSLQRWMPAAFADDSANWFTAGVTAGGAPAPNLAPTVTFSQPVNGGNFLRPTNIALTVSTDDPDGVVTRVEYFVDDVFVGDSTFPPDFRFVWTNAPFGPAVLTARARDNGLAFGYAPPVNLKVASQPPLVTLTSPTNRAVYAAGDSVILAASASDLDGVVRAVDFVVDGVVVATDTNTPFSATWSDVPAGHHVLQAVATDDSGTMSTSVPVNVVVAALLRTNLLLVASNQVWRYLETATTPDAAWITPEFDDSSWKSGPAQLGYGETDQSTLITNRIVVGGVTNRLITHYFRRQFTVDSLAGVTNVLFRVLRDDGAVGYLNGVEVFRSNMATGRVTATNLAIAAVSSSADENTFFPTNLPISSLRLGVNTVAVEVHQNVATSSDMSFAAEVLLQRNMVGPVITHEPAGITNSSGSTINFMVAATGSQPLAYQWYFNSTPLAGESAPTLVLPQITPGQAGAYRVVVSNLAAAVTSAVAILSVTSPDTDGDGLPDDWETANGTNPLLVDAEADPDQDGLNNRQEFIAGTHPIDAASVLRITSITLDNGGTAAVLQFPAISGRGYTVLSRPQTGVGNWLKLVDVPSLGISRVVTITNQLDGAPARYYRIVTPPQP